MSSTIVHLNDLGNAEPSAFGFRTKEHSRLDRVQNTISGVCAWVAGISVVVLCALTLVEVVMRSVFRHPLGWNVSVIEKFLLPAIAFFGLVTAYRTASHIAVASLFALLSPRVRKVILVFIHVLVLTVLLTLMIAGWNQVATAVELGHRVLPGLADLPLPDWTFLAIVPLSAVLGALVVILDLLREIITPWDRPYTDYDPGEEH
ncbi:TRAP transporter small permease [Corynebacterium sp.]|uniref:TRAP transporter small permease n=1 Tax=Corynebacterium sp. TaxID=1720 RepID=UPI0028B19F09|nr:TRAP transporter small permease [Corynebacterium sp.]